MPRGRVGRRGSTRLILGEEGGLLVVDPQPAGGLFRREPLAVDLDLAEQSPCGRIGRINLDGKLQQATAFAS